MPLLPGTIRNSVWTGSSVVLYVEPRAGQIPTGDGLDGKIAALYEPSGRSNHTLVSILYILVVKPVTFGL